MKDEKAKQSPIAGENSKPESTEKNLKSKTSSAEQDLDSFLLGDLEDSDGGQGMLFLTNKLIAAPFISVVTS